MLIKIGNGYFSNKPGNLTIASHCSPVLLDRRPEVQIPSSPIYHCHESNHFYFRLTRWAFRDFGEQGNLNIFKEIEMKDQYFGLIQENKECLYYYVPTTVKIVQEK